MKGVALTQASLQSALAGVGILQDPGTSTSLVTNSIQGNVVLWLFSKSVLVNVYGGTINLSESTPKIVQ